MREKGEMRGWRGGDDGEGGGEEERTRNTRADFNRSATSVIQNAPLECPPFRRPNPAHDRAVDLRESDTVSHGSRGGEGGTNESRPAEEEDASGEDTTAFGGGTDEDGRDEGGEHVLVAVEGVESVPGERERREKKRTLRRLFAAPCCSPGVRGSRGRGGRRSSACRPKRDHQSGRKRGSSCTRN